MMNLKKWISFTVLASTLSFAAAQSQSGGQQAFVLADGTVVKVDLPGTFRGNPQSDRPDAEKKVYICHATSAVDNNGYVIIHVGDPALAAHLAHEHATPNGNGQGKQPRDEEGRIVYERCQPAIGS